MRLGAAAAALTPARSAAGLGDMPGVPAFDVSEASEAAWEAPREVAVPANWRKRGVAVHDFDEF